MNQSKVWIIKDEDWNRGAGNSRTVAAASPERPVARQSPVAGTTPESSDKSPALAFSLAMLVWGSGHLYCKNYRTGALFLIAMALFYPLLLWYWLARSDAAVSGPFASSFIAGGTLFSLLGLVCWLANAVNAYYRAVKKRSAPFRGQDRETLALAGSVLFPGWGQFLNGQPVKGTVFLLFGGLGVFALGLILTIPYWGRVIETSSIGVLLDRCFVVALVLLPCSLLAWIFAAYDAVCSCRKLVRKKLAQQNPGYRAGGRGLRRNLLPRSTAVLSLMLALSLGMQFIPRIFYRDTLEKLRLEMAELHLEAAPGLLQKVRDLLN
jgi:hypothetical protein